jgi:hypothetical protein
VGQPTEHYRFHVLAALLAMTHNRPAYVQLCHRIFTTFTNTTNPYVAERMADDYLLMQHSSLDLSAADNLAEEAVSLGGGDDLLPYIQACKAMADYRLGRFAESIEWAKKPFFSGSQVYAESQSLCHIGDVALAAWAK